MMARKQGDGLASTAGDEPVMMSAEKGHALAIDREDFANTVFWSFLPGRRTK